MATWKEDIIKALENLGGVAHRSKIHEEVSKIREGNLNNTWTQTIQRELETYSSDSDAYAGREDLFFMAEGKGQGVWGLRNFKDGGLVFGEIDNVNVGQIFESRDALSKARIHGPTMAGIWGRESEGACSIVLSGGYEDDIDDLNYILYTGQGGQDRPGGNQVADQGPAALFRGTLRAFRRTWVSGRYTRRRSSARKRNPVAGPRRPVLSQGVGVRGGTAGKIGQWGNCFFDAIYFRLRSDCACTTVVADNLPLAKGNSMSTLRLSVLKQSVYATTGEGDTNLDPYSRRRRLGRM